MTLPATRSFNIRRMRRVDGGVDWESDVDIVAREEPLNISLHTHRSGTETLALTMRTPGQDRELVAGFLLAEGILTCRTDLEEIRLIGVEAESSNEVLAFLAPQVDLDIWRLRRPNIVNSSCGLCGKSRTEAIAPFEELSAGLDFMVRGEAILQLPDLLRAGQAGFNQTGGLHAAALFLIAGETEPQLLCLFEDVGRHNAVDKVLGWALLREMLPLSQHVLFLSSRSSYELVQKAVAAGTTTLACVGSPSSLAVEMARNAGLTLIGFVRENRFNVYSGEWRIRSK